MFLSDNPLQIFADSGAGVFFYYLIIVLVVLFVMFRDNKYYHYHRGFMPWNPSNINILPTSYHAGKLLSDNPLQMFANPERVFSFVI